MSLKIWIDGKLVDKADAKISVYDHGLLYGDGIFEGIRVYNGKIFECDAHVRRLYDSAKAIRLKIPLGPAELKSAMEQTVKANGFNECYIRVLVTRGVGSLGIDPNKCANPSLIIIADIVQVYPREMFEKGIAVITASTLRMHPSALSPRIKSLNYLNNILARIEANDAGVSEAIMLNHEGNVAEGTVQNVFIVRETQVQTPTTHDGILEGVTRRVMLEICHKLAIPCVEKSIQRLDLYIADEMFLTGTGGEVMPVTKIDGRQIGSGEVGPITRRLKEAFHQRTRE
ncbi:MAG TPA: branched-chain-amino-acid transaminase [Tepidisphaeraceae bacterium]|jgi:branched-chain amino acid aminotransferase|nr:branched-chain-amino-acid transaminase [Tepidisphaeraceae bacterium]